MQTTIIIATHKPYWIPEDPMYLPVQMGHAIHPGIGYIGDDTGENISERNGNFCELTGLYWAAKTWIPIISASCITAVTLPAACTVLSAKSVGSSATRNSTLFGHHQCCAA